MKWSPLTTVFVLTLLAVVGSAVKRACVTEPIVGAWLVDREQSEPVYPELHWQTPEKNTRNEC